MAVSPPQSAPAPAAIAPSCIQPGGGFCFDLELAWGRLRRAWLRRFRPSYVRRMLALRQGECPNCPHDIIDPRDLKPYRNICGFWFRPENDPFRWRDRIPLARPGLAEVVWFSGLFLMAAAACILGGLFLHPAVYALLAPVLGLWFFILSFFRNPRRSIPTDPAALLSPADGTVTHVEEIDDSDFPHGRAFRISMFLSVFNVHVNRTPRPGRVLGIRYFPGSFLDARNHQSVVRNEQLWIDMEEKGSGRPLRVKQISGAVARRIVCCLKPGQEVNAGELFGMIKFGSRTDILIPADEPRDVLVKVGDKVKGGSTILLRFK
jgi:phosphatidylserine decarboxylase